MKKAISTILRQVARSYEPILAHQAVASVNLTPVSTLSFKAEPFAVNRYMSTKSSYKASLVKTCTNRVDTRPNLNFFAYKPLSLEGQYKHLKHSTSLQASDFKEVVLKQGDRLVGSTGELIQIQGHPYLMLYPKTSYENEVTRSAIAQRQQGSNHGFGEFELNQRVKCWELTLQSGIKAYVVDSTAVEILGRPLSLSPMKAPR